MKNMKKLFIVLVVLALALVAVACAQTTPQASKAPQATTAAPAATAAATKWTDEKEIRIGWYGPLTGNSSLIGNESAKGARLAAKLMNDKGGINGVPIKMIEYDDKSLPEQAVKNVTKMITSDKVHAIVGSLHSGNIQASADVVEQAKIPEIGTGTSPTWLDGTRTYLFRSLPNSTWGSIMMIDAMKKLNIKNISSLIRQDDYAKTSYADLKKKMDADGSFKILLEEAHQPGDVDYSGQLTKMINAKPDGLICYGLNTDADVELKQARQLGFFGYIFGPEGFGSPDVRDVSGKYANGGVFAQAYLIPDSQDTCANDLEKTMVDAFVKENGKLPQSDNAYRTYDAMNLFGVAITNAKSLDGTAIRDAIENITDYKGLAGTFNFKGNKGEGIKGTRIFIIHGNKNIYYDDFVKSNPVDYYKPTVTNDQFK